MRGRSASYLSAQLCLSARAELGGMAAIVGGYVTENIIKQCMSMIESPSILSGC